MPKHFTSKHVAGSVDKDKELKELVAAALKREMHDSALGINIAARDGIVSLWGMVDVLAEKIFAEKLAREIPGVRGVDNGLTVAVDNFLPDRDINELVLERFSHSANSGVRKLGAETKDGVVCLLGHAESQGVVREAEKIAAGVRGVKEIQSQVKVAEDSPPDDATITNAVERAFVNSDLVSARRITTSCEHGVVKLQGMVDTLDEIESAVEVAYRVSGVKAVHSEVRARHGETDGDKALTNELRDMLSKETNLSRGTIKAHVVNGMAFLTGEVYDVDAKRRAEEITRQLSGLTGISNTIQVSAHQL